MPKVNLPDNVFVNVNESGTMNLSLVCDFVDKVIKPDCNTDDSIVFMDEFKSHFTQPVIEAIHGLGVDYNKIPGGLTATLQPLDVSINKPFKQLYRDEYEAWLDSPNPIFTKNGNRQKPSYQCLVDMVSRCVTEMQKREEVIKKSFVCTGIVQSEEFSPQFFHERLRRFFVNSAGEDNSEEIESEEIEQAQSVESNDADNDSEIVMQGECSFFKL